MIRCPRFSVRCQQVCTPYRVHWSKHPKGWTPNGAPRSTPFGPEELFRGGEGMGGRARRGGNIAETFGGGGRGLQMESGVDSAVENPGVGAEGSVSTL